MKYGLLFLVLFIGLGCWAQPSGCNQDYEELTDTKPIDQQAWEKCKTPVSISWGSADVRYSKTNVPPLAKAAKKWKGTVWKGERINAQAVIWATVACPDLIPSATDLVSADGNIIPASAIKVSFVRFVMTDQLNKNGDGTCGYRPDNSQFDSSVVADVLDLKNVYQLQPRNTEPIWVNIYTPRNCKAGIYKGKINFTAKGRTIPSLDIELNVLNRELPAPKDWAFSLDLWQNPFAVARYHNLPLWSDEHFEAMRPVMQILADAGQKIITASIMHKPWGGQTEDYFESMVMRVKRLDGTWSYDYAVFDKWVEFMISLGIDQQINCYTMIPWDLSFQYFDQASNSLKFVKAEVGSPEFDGYWRPFLVDFARHLKEKKWFDIATIAMDERSMKSMQQVIKIVKEADPAYKLSLAGSYHSEIEADLYDYSLASREVFPDDVLAERRARGMKSTYYTCCSESYPNTFTFSPVAESAWLGWYAAAKNFDGYLRWAYSSWTKDPLKDSRFRAFGGGDCYLVYPGGRSSIRMERLIEGIQDYEKVRILKTEFKQKGETAKLNALNKILKDFEIPELPKKPAAGTVTKARNGINKF